MDFGENGVRPKAWRSGFFYDNISDMKKRQGSSLTGITLASALTLAVVLLVSARSPASDSPTPGIPADIAVEHASSLTLSLRYGTGRSRGIVEIVTEGNDASAISVPEAWQRREVRGGTLAAVTADPPSLGFVRWHLPPRVTLSFWTPAIPSLVVKNASKTPLLVVTKRVDVVSGKVLEDSVIIKDKEVMVW